MKPATYGKQKCAVNSEVKNKIKVYIFKIISKV